MPTTIGRILVGEVLPPGFNDVKEPLTADNLEAALQHVIDTQPDQYRTISKKLLDLGGKASFHEGVTLNLSDTLHAMPNRQMWLDHIRDQQAKIEASDATDKEKAAGIADLYNSVYGQITDENYQTALAKNNPFALQVKSKARGNKLQLAQLMATPGTFQDAKGRTIPVFIGHSYAEGLKPAEYWAATYGARKSVKSTKFATREAGELGKQMIAAAMRMVVTSDDCETPSGIPVKADDVDNIGAVLARPAGKIPAGTVITKAILAQLKDQDQILVRSPITCGMDKGVCKQCAGIRETGRFPEKGAYIGVSAGSALAERIAQGALNVKHSGGQTSKKGRDPDDDSGTADDDLGGFDFVEQFTQIPDTFKNRATLATVPGTITKIEPAAQGGTHIEIDGTVHYALPGHKVRAKIGDTVEPGDQLSSGLVNPAEVIEHKGLGEGRRYFTERLTKLLRSSGWNANRRNVEVLSRSLLDHVTLDDDIGNGLVGDTVSYSNLAYNYKPREGTMVKPLKDAQGMYLESPTLHYTIGSRVDRKMADTLNKFGIKDVTVHKEPVSFTPFMPSLRSAPFYEKDWMAQLGSSYLESNLLKNVHRGATSTTSGEHPIPGIAKGVDFGIQE